jgi:hypothetical protein
VCVLTNVSRLRDHQRHFQMPLAGSPADLYPDGNRALSPDRTSYFCGTNLVMFLVIGERGEFKEPWPDIGGICFDG